MAIAGLLGGAVLVPVAIATPPWSVLPLIVVSAVAETAYAVCLSAAYARGAMSVAYPIGRGTAPLLVTAGAWLLLGQRSSGVAILGAGALGAGLSLIALAGRRTGQMAAVGFAAITGLAIAAYSLIDAQAVQTVSPVSYLGAVLALEGLILLGLVRVDRHRLRCALGSGVRVAVGTVAAYVLVLVAFQHADAGRVATLRETAVLFGLLLARERLGKTVWVGASFIVLGAVLSAV